MNFILRQTMSPALATLVHSRARQVVEEVRHCLDMSRQGYRGQSGYFQWATLEGQGWGVFEDGRCTWLLVVQKQGDKVLYYRNRRDLDHYEIHETGHGGTVVCQTVEQLGLVNNHYQCETSCNGMALERKLRWFNLQRWLHRMHQGVRSLNRQAA